MKIRLLEESDILRANEIYADCLSENHFFHQIYLDTNSRIIEMRKDFLELTTYCIDNKTSFGVFKNNSLVGIGLACNYNDTLKNRYYSKIFGSKFYSPELQEFLDYINKETKDSGKETLYILAFAVLPEHRKQGMAKTLLSEIIKFNYNLCCDISNIDTLNMYLKLGFRLNRISDNYYAALRISGECWVFEYEQLCRLQEQLKWKEEEWQKLLELERAIKEVKKLQTERSMPVELDELKVLSEKEANRKERANLKRKITIVKRKYNI